MDEQAGSDRREPLFEASRPPIVKADYHRDVLLIRPG